MPKYPGTTIRSVRVDDELWEEGMRAAQKRDESLSDVLRRALADYIATSATA